MLPVCSQHVGSKIEQRTELKALKVSHAQKDQFRPAVSQFPAQNFKKLSRKMNQNGMISKDYNLFISS